MCHNVGNLDRKLRLVIGVVLIVWGLIAQNWLGAIGLIPLLTGIFRFCPLYTIIKFSSSEEDDCDKKA